MLISSTALPSASCSCLTADPLKAQLRASSSPAITVSAELCLCSLGAASPFWKLTSSLKWVWLERGAAAFSVFSLKDHKLKFKSLNGWLLAKLVIKQVCWDYKLQQQGWGNHLAFWSRPTLHIWNTLWGKMLMKSLPLLVTIKHPSTKYLYLFKLLKKSDFSKQTIWEKSDSQVAQMCWTERCWVYGCSTWGAGAKLETWHETVMLWQFQKHGELPTQTSSLHHPPAYGRVMDTRAVTVSALG